MLLSASYIIKFMNNGQLEKKFLTGLHNKTK